MDVVTVADDRQPPRSLYVFHRVLIGSAIALSGLLCAWGISKGDSGSLGLAGFSGVMAIGLAFYLRRFNRKTRK